MQCDTVVLGEGVLSPWSSLLRPTHLPSGPLGAFKFSLPCDMCSCGTLPGPPAEVLWEFSVLGVFMSS